MKENGATRPPASDGRIDVEQPFELDYWSSRLGVPVRELQHAVRRVGVRLEDILLFLRTEADRARQRR